MRNFTPKFLILCCSFFGTAYAQKAVDLQNCREGESIEYCTQHKKLAEELKDPAFAKAYKMAENLYAEEFKKNKNEINAKGVVYRIPVVFHILHNGGAENISDEQIQDGLRIWNNDFRRLNADADNVHADFQGLPADVEIEFVLATKAPNGACFNGITRTKSAMSFQGANGNSQVNAIVAGNDVYNQTWPGNKYLNIFVCGDIGGAAGYVQGASTFSSAMTNGIWVLHEYVGSIGTGNVTRSRTLTHECGHWLGLPHCWGSTNNPGLPSNCDTDDNIEDTPNTIGVSACNLNENTCGPRANVENYMDYSYCSKMFTAGQVTRMRAVLTSSNGGRNNLSSTNNIAATGADSNFTLCKAAFISDRQSICEGETISYTDRSYHEVSGWNWSFPGGTPSTSIAQNPVVTYNTPGKHAVTLTVTDGGSNVSTTKTGYVNVLAAGKTLPYKESFEDYTSLTQANSFFRVDPSVGANNYEVYTGAGSTGNKSIRLRNFNLPSGSNVLFETGNFDLSEFNSSDVVTVSFKYAYRKKNANNNEVLRVLASNNCGESFTSRKTISNTQLSNQVVSSEWVPKTEDWVQVHVLNILSAYFVENTQLQFLFESNGGNNLYIDDLFFYRGGPSSIGLEEFANVNNLNLYPNPADEVVNVTFEVARAGEVTLDIVDLTGKVIGQYAIQATPGENIAILNTADYKSGMYLLKIKSENSQNTIQFAVK